MLHLHPIWPGVSACSFLCYELFTLHNLEVQEAEYAGRPACLDVARAECLKLKGNIFVAEAHLQK